MTSKIRKLVSKKKRRFNQNGFDLDLTYIRDDIVAMGFPSENVEGIYRNNMKEVQRFFHMRHGQNYKVYNLCSERSYEHSKFGGNVACYPFDDHNAPPFEMIKPFCEDVYEWLSRGGGDRVVAIHCKAGKGRTGVMIAAYLVHCGMWEKPAEALQFYGAARTKNTKGVTIPSQRRYVTYYGHMLRKNLTYRPTSIFFRGIVMNGIPYFEGTKVAPMFIIKRGNEVIYKSEVYDLDLVSKVSLPDEVDSSRISGVGSIGGSGGIIGGWDEGVIEDRKKRTKSIRKPKMTKKDREEYEQRNTQLELLLTQPVELCGDIKIEIFHKKKTNKVFHLWINTFFHNGKSFHIEKEEIDKINKDKHHKVTHPEFSVDLLFTGQVVQDGAKTARKINIFNGRQTDLEENVPEDNLSDDEDEIDEWAEQDYGGEYDETNAVVPPQPHHGQHAAPVQQQQSYHPPQAQHSVGKAHRAGSFTQPMGRTPSHPEPATDYQMQAPPRLGRTDSHASIYANHTSQAPAPSTSAAYYQQAPQGDAYNGQYQHGNGYDYNQDNGQYNDDDGQFAAGAHYQQGYGNDVQSPQPMDVSRQYSVPSYQ